MATSWVIVRKSDGRALVETFDYNRVLALNSERYNAVPILEYLQNLNREIAMKYDLTCLLCATTGRNHVSNSLVTIQEHAMTEHGYKQEDHQNTTKREVTPGHYVYTFPDGKDWLDAQRVGGNTLEGL